MRKGLFTLHCNGGLLEGTMEGEIILIDIKDIEFVPPKERFAKMFLK